MIVPATIPLVGYRTMDFEETIPIEGLDLTGGAAKMQVRLGPGTPGTPLINLTMAGPGVQGLSFTVDTSGAEPITYLTIVIGYAAMAALPAPGEQGDDLQLAYDIPLASSITGGRFAVWVEGSLTVKPGVTA